MNFLFNKFLSIFYKGAGRPHNCCKSQAVVNLTHLAFGIGALQAEQLASNIIKNKMEKENLIEGATFNLSTGGNPIQITVGISDLKSERTKSANMTPFQMLLTLQAVLELSKAGTQVLVSSLKSSFRPNCITKNIFGKLEVIC